MAAGAVKDPGLSAHSGLTLQVCGRSQELEITGGAISNPHQLHGPARASPGLLRSERVSAESREHVTDSDVTGPGSEAAAEIRHERKAPRESGRAATSTALVQTAACVAPGGVRFWFLWRSNHSWSRRLMSLNVGG